MGEDVGEYGGCFAVSMGLLDEFGPERIRDTPLSESAFVGAGIGAAIGGHAPDRRDHDRQLQPARARPDPQQRRDVPAHVGRSVQRPARDPHDDRRRPPGRRRSTRTASKAGTRTFPGLRILTPATVEDARGMLWPALLDPDPVLIFEHASLYNTSERARRRRRAGRHHARRGAPARRRRHAHRLRRHAAHRARGGRRARERRRRSRRDRPAHAAARSTTRRSSSPCAGRTAP